MNYHNTQYESLTRSHLRLTPGRFALVCSASRRVGAKVLDQCYHAENRHERTESGRFQCFAYEDLVQCDNVNLDIFWLKDELPEDSSNLPAPDVIASEMVENLEGALAQFAEIAADLATNEKAET